MKAQEDCRHESEELRLLNNLRNGDREAFRKIFVDFWRRLYIHAHSKLDSKEDAEEIVQDIFTSLWVKREELLITNLSNYLHSAVKNKVLNCIRTRIVHQKYWDYYKRYVPYTQLTTEEDIYFMDLKAALDNSAQELSDKSRTIFFLSQIEGYSNHEIATRLNVSEKVVEYHITKSKKTLKNHLKDYLTSFIFIVSTIATRL